MSEGKWREKENQGTDELRKGTGKGTNKRRQSSGSIPQQCRNVKVYADKKHERGKAYKGKHHIKCAISSGLERRFYCKFRWSL